MAGIWLTYCNPENCTRPYEGFQLEAVLLIRIIHSIKVRFHFLTIMLSGVDSADFSLCPSQLIKCLASKIETIVLAWKSFVPIGLRLESPALKNIVGWKKFSLGFLDIITILMKTFVIPVKGASRGESRQLSR